LLALNHDIEIILRHILPSLCQEILFADTESVIYDKIIGIYAKQADGDSSNVRQLVYKSVTLPYLNDLVAFFSRIPYEVVCNNKYLYSNKVWHCVHTCSLTNILLPKLGIYCL